jgi:hypothetical protein
MNFARTRYRRGTARQDCDSFGNRSTVELGAACSNAMRSTFQQTHSRHQPSSGQAGRGPDMVDRPDEQIEIGCRICRAQWLTRRENDDPTMTIEPG